MKPSIFKNEILGTADPLYTILFECLWCLADREGRLEDRPMRIKVEAFPYRDGINTEAMLNWLENNNFIQRFSHGDEKYIQIINFKKHQNPHIKETASSIPAPVKPGAGTGNSGTSHADSLNPLTDSLKPVTPSSSEDARPQSDVQTVFQHWQQKLNHPQAKLTPERQRKISVALKNYSAASLCQAIDGCSVTPHNLGHNDRGEVYDDISLIVRDAEHIERFMRNAKQPPKLNGGHHAKPSKLQQAANAIREYDERLGRRSQNTAFQDVVPEPGLRAITRRSSNGDPGHD